jgi:tripartite motif-containing protein 71
MNHQDKNLATHDFRMNRTGLIFAVFSLCLGVGRAWGAPQDHWYAERERNFGYIGGMHQPIGIAHGNNRRIFVVEFYNGSIQLRDQSQGLITRRDSGENPRSATFADGRAYVVSAGSEKVYVFDENGTSLFSFGSNGSGDGQFKNPYGIAAGYHGNDLEIFVSDPSVDRVSVFDANGTYLRKFSTVDGEARGVAVDQNGSVYVADAGERVNVFDRNGTLLRTITGIAGNPYGLSIFGNRLAVGNADGNHDYVKIYDLNGSFVRQFGGDGTGNGKFRRPLGVAYDANGSLWVADYGNHRVQVFDENGTFISKVGQYASESTSLNNPMDIAYGLGTYIVSDSGNNRVVAFDDRKGTFSKILVNGGSGYAQVSGPRGIALDSQGRIFVVDRGNQRIQSYDSNGTHLNSFGNPQLFNDVWGVAVAPDGNIYVSDFGADKILVFDGSGNFSGSWGEAGNLSHQLNGPSDLHIGPEGDLYVADYYNYSIKRFTVAGELILKIDLRQHGGSGNSDDRRGSRPRTVSVREDGLIITSAYYDHYRGKFWVFDKSGNSLWTRTKSWTGNYSGTRGCVAFNSMGKFVWVWDKYDQFARYHSTYRAGPWLRRDAIPYPMLISATQEFETTDLDIVYKVTDVDDANVTTGLLAYIDGDDSFDKILLPKTFIGDVTGKIGQNVDVNVTHSLSWDMPSDWNASVGTVAVEVFAKDDRELLDLHFVEIPGDENNATPLTINRFPLENDDFLAAYRYLLATGDTEIKLERGLVLMSDANTTPISPDTLSGLALWLDGSDIDGNGQPDSLNDGDLISFWKDKSGNDFNASQSEDTSKPVYRNTGQVPHLHFNDKKLKISTANIQAKHVFIVALSDETSRYKTLMAGAMHRNIRTSAGSLRFNEKVTHTFAGTDRNYRVDGIIGNEFKLSQMHILFAELGSDSQFGGLYTDVNIGGDNGVNNHWNGNIYEILVFDEFLSGGQIKDIEWYLGQKWGIFGPGPNGYLAINKDVRVSGENFLLERMNLRPATALEISRAKKGTTPGTVNQFTPDFQIKPGGDPEKINEFTIETKKTGGVFVVPI